MENLTYHSPEELYAPQPDIRYLLAMMAGHLTCDTLYGMQLQRTHTINGEPEQGTYTIREP